MVSFFKWLIVQSVIWALALGGGHYWLAEEPRRILIGIDASFSMKRDWDKVRTIIDGYARQRRYSEFALVTGKSRIHGWQESPQMGNLITYGPRRLDRITDTSRYPEINEADKRVLITNDGAADFSDWQEINP